MFKVCFLLKAKVTHVPDGSDVSGSSDPKPPAIQSAVTSALSEFAKPLWFSPLRERRDTHAQRESSLGN